MRRVKINEFRGTKAAESLRIGYFPGKHVTTLIVEDVENDEENFAKISRVIRMLGGKILLVRPSSPTKKIVDVMFVIELPRKLEEELCSKIESLGLCKQVTVIESFNPNVFFNVFFPYIVSGCRAIIMREPMYKGILLGMRRRFGEGAAKVFLNFIGYEVGKEAAASISPIIKDLELVKAVETFLLMGQALGYAIVESVEKVDDKIIVRLLYSWEGEIMRSMYDTPQCYFNKGILEGFLLALTGEKWVGKEVECVAKGDDRCIFILEREYEAEAEKEVSPIRI